MDYELAYARRRAAEEIEAARSAVSADARERHLKLARAFEDHINRIPGAAGIGAELHA